ncbi:MAG: SMP-30/gluconolactonase/LRE family protein [Actinobacteria bacterium]|nr:SMP-30/gluconolactonase/LRE family protein [Actinomycetota bacterium]
MDAAGNVYAAVATLDVATSGVYKVARDGSFTRLPGTEAIVFPNGVTLDKRGNIYATDTVLGAVSRIRAKGDRPSSGSSRRSWRAMAASGSGVPLGANGIAFGHNEIVVGNTEFGRLVRIEIEPDGSAGAFSILAEDPALLAVDGITFDVHGNVWAAVIAQSTIVRVSPSGAVTTVATVADCLDWASSIAFGKNGDLWAVDFAIGPPGGPGPALLRLEVGVKGQPVP